MHEDSVRQIWRKVLAAINSCAGFLIGMTACEHHSLFPKTFFRLFLHQFPANSQDQGLVLIPGSREMICDYPENKKMCPLALLSPKKTLI
jgi:hypothetical protein